MIATIIQALGTIIVTIGVWMAWPPLGVIVGGLAVLSFGLALERSQ